MQGMAFAKHVFGDDPQGKPDYDYIPSAVFSSPPIANVGLTEEEAAEKYKNVDVFTSSYKCAAPLSACMHCLHCCHGASRKSMPWTATKMQMSIHIQLQVRCQRTVHTCGNNSPSCCCNSYLLCSS